MQKTMAENFYSIPENIKCLILDFDGVFTDNKVYVFQDGKECVRCDRGDGAGIAKLKTYNFNIMVLSAEKNPIVTTRCAKLNIECCQGIDEKSCFLNSWLINNNMEWNNIIYVGNDEKDIECIKKAAIGIVPADANVNAKQAANIILKNDGGNGAIREVCDMIIDALDRKKRIFQNSEQFTKYHIGQRDERPWGNWQVLANSDEYCIKIIQVNPEGQLSLQYHNHREEVWKIIGGSGICNLDDEVRHVKKGDIFMIKPGKKHRIKNDGIETLKFIEIQTGDILSENDIVRLEDKYNRI